MNNEEADKVKDGAKGQPPQQINWWGVLGLLCVIASAYLSIRIISEVVILLGSGP